MKRLTAALAGLVDRRPRQHIVVTLDSGVARVTRV
jgi:hypothetical protein